ncbi:hypothetical protein H2203_005880 [Taxawa tesnikishii (nom. ined.)]|nr:hypothetical protein H2203_005880 [Dothideales sp. JES 119]
MATTMFPSTQRRKKLATYGKPKRNTGHGAHELTDFLGESQTDQSTPEPAPTRVATALTKTKPTIVRTTAHERPKNAISEFDVPSEDEAPAPIPAPIRNVPRSKLARPAKPTQNKTISSEFDVPSSEDDAPAPPPAKTTRLTRQAETSQVQKESRKHTAQEKEVSKVKHPVIEEAPPLRNLPARKRKRTPAPPVQQQVQAIEVDEDTHHGHAKPPVQRPTTNKPMEKKQPLPVTEPAVVEQNPTRRSERRRGAGQPARPSPRKGLSAPTLLSGMIPSEDSLPDAQSLTPSVMPDGMSTPRKTPAPQSQDPLPSTPLAHLTSSPPAVPRSGSITPKQNQLWKELLPSSDPVSESPDTSKIASLKIADNAQSRRGQRMRPPGLARSASDVPKSSIKSRARLVDRLKQTAVRFTIDEEDDEEEEEASDMMELDQPSTGSQASSQQDTQGSAHLAQSRAAADSQKPNSQVAEQATGPKITYTRQRSYRPDSIEDDLLLSLPIETPQRPSAGSRRTATAPTPTAKLVALGADDDSDDQTHAVKSIHELRAAGNKQRFMDDIDMVMGDIKDHKPTSRGRRRGALIELATKLLDKAFVLRFVEHGYLEPLAIEISSDHSEPVADVVLCAAIALILTAEPAPSALKPVTNADVATFLGKRLENDGKLDRLVKERRNNMSKAAQSTFLEFVETVRTAPIWDSRTPEVLTSRVLALKCMETLYGQCFDPQVGTVARTLAGCAATAAVMGQPPPDRILEAEMALSILDSLSMVQTLNGPDSSFCADALDGLGVGLSELLGGETASAKMRTETLKFCLNATNNSARNCERFTGSEVVRSMLDRVIEGCGCFDRELDEQARATELDLLLLTLGLLINLAEHSIAVCNAAEACDGRLPALVRIFLQGREKAEEANSVEETQENVAYGYLAVLLANICQGEKGDISVLVNVVREFVQYQRITDNQAFEGEEGRDVRTHFTDRLAAVVKRVIEADSRGGDVLYEGSVVMSDPLGSM